MIKPIAIIAGEPNSISSEIIFKMWMTRKRNKYKPFIVIGNFKILDLQRKFLSYKIKFHKINNSFNLKNFKKSKLLVYDVKYKQKKAFTKITTSSNNYIFKCFDAALNLVKNKKISGFINCPICKETLFKKKHQGITEYLGKKSGVAGKEVMLIFNKKLSVSPVTTHISINSVSKNLKKSSIIKNVITINNFYLNHFNKKPKIALLGLNPHNYSVSTKSEEEKIISPAINIIKKLKINVIGPLSPDTAFMVYRKHKVDVIIGMYHDQVLSPFKTIFGYDAINVTLGLPYLRVSPDHGIGRDIIGKNVASPKSLIESIKFFNHIKKI